MRIYQNLKEAIKETERELVEMGVEVLPETMQDKETNEDEHLTKELQGYGYIITSHLRRDETFIELGGDLRYAVKEFEERIDSHWINPGEAYLTRKGTWEEFLHKGKFSYTYNERFREQLVQVIEELRLRPNTRQAVVTIYDRHQDLNNMGGIARIPCSMHYQFLRRKRNGQEVLDCIYIMRSCDFYTHFIYDVWLAMRLQEFLAGTLGIEPGNFTHFVGSLHAYKKDYETKGVF